MDLETTGPTEKAGPRRGLGLATATALVVGEVIGVGIFLTPAKMAKTLGSPAWMLAVWLGMGLATSAGALCLGALAACFPEAGGGYVYLRHAFGRRPAFLFGWMSLFVTDPGLTAAFAAGLGEYAAALVPLSPIGRKLVGIGAILAVAAANVGGVRLGAGLVRGLTALKLGLLGFLALWGFGLARGSWSNFVPFVARRPGSVPLAGAIVGATLSAFFAFGGWWDATKVAGEVRNPARTMPRALMLGVALLTIAYVTTSAVFLYLVPPSRIDPDRGFAAQAGSALFGAAGGEAFAAMVVVIVLGSLAGFMLSAPRVYFAMARDGLFLTPLAALDPRTGAPARAIALQASLASILVAVGTFDQIVAYFVVPTVAFLAAMVASVYVLEGPSTRVPGYPVTPLLFLVPVAAVLALLALSGPERAAISLGVVALGVPVDLVLARRRGLDSGRVADGQ
ncbi:MAG TPA: amino acid permease [Isosphaeraceae bacterium]|jgi:APA family basic amino acid/polyamine antiporter|nr:amino acid permease [Isosphaeraceae bacterium]